MQIASCIFLAILWIAWLPLCLPLSREGTILFNFSKRFYSDPHGAFHKWNNSDESPCAWPGVICIEGQVKKVNLSYQLLAGPLDPELAQITTIQDLLLAGNFLNGSIPEQLGYITDLTILDLSHNSLAGKIPADICNALNLTKLYLNNNALEGNLPAELGKLTKLRELRLDRNKLSGDILGTSKENSTKVMHLESPSGTNNTLIMGLCLLKNLKVANFAFNYFTGLLPSCLHGSSLSFQWNCLDTTLPRQRPAKQCGLTTKSIQSAYGIGTSKHVPPWRKHLQAVLIAGVFVCVLLLLAVFFRYRHVAVPIAPSKSGYFDVLHKASVLGTPLIPRAELEAACEDFSNIIDTTPDGIIFKGTLSNGSEIAVLKVQTCGWSKDLDSYFRYKVDRLARINHKHVVKLLGYCTEDEPFTRMLVFEYMPNGTLFDLLHNGDAEQLDWNARMRVLMGVAYGLEYLHHSLLPPAGYSNFNSSAVYLTEDNAAKLAGFDVGPPPVGKKGKGEPYTNVNTSECDGIERTFQSFEVTVFEFGVLLLELISGRLPCCKEQGSITDWAADYLSNPDVIAYMVDPTLRFFNYTQLESLCEITSLCIGADSNRPSMKVVTSLLEAALGITSEAACSKQSPLLWAELAILTQM